MHQRGAKSYFGVSAPGVRVDQISHLCNEFSWTTAVRRRNLLFAPEWGEQQSQINSVTEGNAAADARRLCTTWKENQFAEAKSTHLTFFQTRFWLQNLTLRIPEYFKSKELQFLRVNNFVWRLFGFKFLCWRTGCFIFQWAGWRNKVINSSFLSYEVICVSRANEIKYEATCTRSFFKTRRSFVVFIPISHHTNGRKESSYESSQGEAKVAADQISNCQMAIFLNNIILEKTPQL